MAAIYDGDQAQKYVAFANHSFTWEYLERPGITKYLPGTFPAGTTALDAGCGSGRSTQILLDLGITSQNITGTDASEDMLKMARQSLPDVKFIHSDLSELEFPEQSFNVIITNMVLFYLPPESLSKVLANFAQWLTVGGQVVISTLHPLRYPVSHARYFYQNPVVEGTAWGTNIENHPHTITAYVQGLLNAGLVLEGFEELQAIPEGKEADPDLYEKYTTMPTRLVVVGRK